MGEGVGDGVGEGVGDGVGDGVGEGVSLNLMEVPLFQYNIFPNLMHL